MQALGGKQPYCHQLKTAENLIEGKSVVLRAPCGSGKTEACYVSLFLGKGSALPDRLIYSLPTRALVEDVSDRIRKGVSQVGLPPIVSPQHGANSEDPFFKGEIVVATIDQTIGAYCCTPLSLPVHLGNIPAGAAVSSFLCFDEAHIYDRLLGLQSMLVLIERAADLDLPFLVMSATLPDSFIEWFRENERFTDKIALVEGREDDVPKRRERHVTLRWMGRLLECKDVLICAGSWRRMMVVCNTVDRAQEIYRLVHGILKSQGFEMFLLHSRFLNKDREAIENNMKACLKDPGRKTCLITTQVCEVGLDISCDSLLTELAPPDSLIQRMGRCAREGGKGEVCVFEVEYNAPYSDEDMERSKKYISERLNAKRIGWDEELEFVNALLSEDFQQIMNDRCRRDKILISLGDAAFKGSKHGIESNIREVLSSNLTIHDSPDKLKYYEILHMPWIDVDIRVLRKYLSESKFWQINFGHDENGKPTFSSYLNVPIHPYEYYVLHPDYARYDSERGLMFGEKGENLQPSIARLDSRPSITYEKETWKTHVDNCLIAFRQVKATEFHALKLFSRIMKCDLQKSEGLLALGVAVHDLGKLNEAWQRNIGIKRADVPLAHVAFEKRIEIPHATISADSSYPMFSKLFGRKIHAIAFKLAVAHHHHTRAEQVRPYVLGWRDLYEKTVNKVCNEYSFDADPKDIRPTERFPKTMETPIPDLESTDSYTAYCTVARLIRLSDRAAFSVEQQKT